MLSTVTDTGADVAWLPGRVRGPRGQHVRAVLLPPVAHAALNGADVSGPPSAAPSTRNCTFATVPELSLAVAAIVTVPRDKRRGRGARESRRREASYPAGAAATLPPRKSDRLDSS